MSETQWEGGKAYRLGSGHATEARKQRRSEQWESKKEAGGDGSNGNVTTTAAL